jgi:hypothetical protein
MAQMAATQADMDAALTAFEQAVQADISEIQAALTAIQQKIGPSVDLSAEVARIQAVQQSLQAEADAVKAAANPTPPPTPTPAPSP